MKLDWRLMRTILAHVEAETIREFVDDAKSSDYWKEGQLLSERQIGKTDPAARVVFKHVQLLVSGGFVEGVYVTESADGFFQVGYAANPSLTLDGYSLLESPRAAPYASPRLRSSSYLESAVVGFRMDGKLPNAGEGRSAQVSSPHKGAQIPKAQNRRGRVHVVRLRPVLLSPSVCRFSVGSSSCIRRAFPYLQSASSAPSKEKHYGIREQGHSPRKRRR